MNWKKIWCIHELIWSTFEEKFINISDVILQTSWKLIVSHSVCAFFTVKAQISGIHVNWIGLRYWSVSTQPDDWWEAGEWLKLLFWNVCSGEPRLDFSHLQQPFDTPAFNKLYRGVSLSLTAPSVVLVPWRGVYMFTMSITHGNDSLKSILAHKWINAHTQHHLFYSKPELMFAFLFVGRIIWWCRSAYFLEIPCSVWERKSLILMV